MTEGEARNYRLQVAFQRRQQVTGPGLWAFTSNAKDLEVVCGGGRRSWAFGSFPKTRGTEHGPRVSNNRIPSIRTPKEDSQFVENPSDSGLLRFLLFQAVGRAPWTLPLATIPLRKPNWLAPESCL